MPVFVSYRIRRFTFETQSDGTIDSSAPLSNRGQPLSLSPCTATNTFSRSIDPSYSLTPSSLMHSHSSLALGLPPAMNSS